MVKVLKTNSGFFLAFKDDVTLSDDEIKQYKQSKYFDTKLSQPFEFYKQFGKADYDITKILLKELSIENPTQISQINELEDISALRKQVLDMARKSGTQPVMAEYEIKTSDLPPQFQNMELCVRRTPEFYFPKYDEQTKNVVCFNEFNNKTKINSTRAAFHSNQKYIEVYDKVFFYTPEMASAINKVKNFIEQNKTRLSVEEILKRIPEKEQTIYAFYLSQKQDYLDEKQKYYSLCHECKHLLVAEDLSKDKTKANYVELSPENFAKYREDDEKAAHLQETYTGIANYFKSGGKLDVFPKKCDWLVKKITPLSPEMRAQVLCDHNYLVNGTIHNWNKQYAPTYWKQPSGQIPTMTLDFAYDASTSSMEYGDAEYLRRRQKLYTLDIYNPQTGKYETKDLSGFIKIPTIIREENKTQISTYNAVIKSRIKKLTELGITPTLIKSLKDGSYQEPFKSRVNLYDIMLKKGISFQTLNDNKEKVNVFMQKFSTDKRENCLRINVSKAGKKVFDFIYDQDRKEYNCFNYNNNQKYSNLQGTKFPNLPDFVIKRVQRYVNVGMQNLQQYIKQKSGDGKGK